MSTQEVNVNIDQEVNVDMDQRTQLLGAGVLCDGLGALRHCVLSQFSGQKKTDGSLDLPGGYGRPLVVMGQLARLSSDPLEQVIHKGVHDGHSLRGNSSVGMNLLQNLIDVDGIGLLPLAFSLLLVALGDSLGSFARLGSSLS